MDDIKFNGHAGELPPYGSGKTVGVFDCGDGVWQMLLECVAEADAQGYVTELEEAGYRLLSGNRKGANVFARPWALIGHHPSPEPLTVAREDGTHRLARSRSCDHTLQDTCELLTLCQG